MNADPEQSGVLTHASYLRPRILDLSSFYRGNFSELSTVKKKLWQSASDTALDRI
jgi:hypothetical protein